MSVTVSVPLYLEDKTTTTEDDDDNDEESGRTKWTTHARQKATADYDDNVENDVNDYVDLYKF